MSVTHFWALINILAILVCGHASAATPKKNVILLVMDTTRADVISAYRTDGRTITPNIDRLAKRGVIFENAYANAPLTTPSTMTIFTGLLPTTHKVHTTGDPRQTLSPEKKTLTEILKAEGYRTFWSGDPSHGNILSPTIGFARGFDKFKKIEIDSAADFIFPTLFPGQKNPAANMIVEWIKEKKDSPFFLFLHSWRPHSPYLSRASENENFLPKSYKGPIIANGADFVRYIYTSDFFVTGLSPQKPDYPKTGPFANDFWRSLMFHDFYSRAFWSLVRTNEGFKEDSQYLRSAYEAAVNHFDNRLGEFLDELNKLGVMKDTIIVITADHGEEFLEHGNFFHQTIFNENLHIPLIFYAEDLPAKRVGQLAQSADIVPTIINMLNIKSKNDYFDGVSLKKSWESDSQASETAEVLTHAEQMGLSSLQNQSYKIIYNHLSKKTDIYDLKTDPGEKTPLKKITKYAQQIESMKRRLSSKIGKIVN